jgi:hypothetical protein
MMDDFSFIAAPFLPFILCKPEREAASFYKGNFHRQGVSFIPHRWFVD